MKIALKSIISILLIITYSSCGSNKGSTRNGSNQDESNKDATNKDAKDQSKSCELVADKSPIKPGEEVKLTIWVAHEIETATILGREVEIGENKLGSLRHKPKETFLAKANYSFQEEDFTCEIKVEVSEDTDVLDFEFSGIWRSVDSQKVGGSACESFEFLLNETSDQLILGDRVYDCDGKKTTLKTDPIELSGNSLIYEEKTIGKIESAKIAYSLNESDPIAFTNYFEIIARDKKVILKEGVKVPAFDVDDNFVSELILVTPKDDTPPKIEFSSTEYTITDRNNLEIIATVTDDTEITYEWKKVSGNASVLFSSQQNKLNVRSREPGVAVISLTATDLWGNSATELITITWELIDSPPINFTATSLGPGVVQLNWEPNPANNGKETGYILEVGIAGNELGGWTPIDGVEYVPMYGNSSGGRQSDEVFIYFGPETQFTEINITRGETIRHYRLHSFDINRLYSRAGRTQLVPSLAESYSSLGQIPYESGYDPAYVGGSAASAQYMYVPVMSNKVLTQPGDIHVAVIDISDPADLKTANTIPFESQIYDVLVDGSFAYFATETGLKVFDISNVPDNPPLVAEESNTGRGILQKKDSILYKAYREYIEIYDVSEVSLREITLLQTLRTFGSTWHRIVGLLVSGNNLFVATYRDGVFWYDISDPANPTKVNNLFSGQIDTVKANNEVVCAIEGYYLNCYDQSEKVNIKKTASYRIVGSDFFIIDSRAYIKAHYGFNNHELDIVDISLTKVGSSALGIIPLDGDRPSHTEVFNGQIYEFKAIGSEIHINVFNDFDFN